MPDFGLLSEHSKQVLANRRRGVLVPIMPSVPDGRSAESRKANPKLPPTQEELMDALGIPKKVAAPTQAEIMDAVGIPKGPLAVPTGTKEKPPTKPIYGPNDPRSRAGKTAISFPPAVQKVADVLAPPGTLSRKVFSVLGAMSTVDPERDVAAELQQASPIEKVMMGLPVGAPVGSLLGGVPKLRQIPGVVEAVGRAGVQKAVQEFEQFPENIKAVVRQMQVKVRQPTITKPVASEALSPAAKAAQTTISTNIPTNDDIIRRLKVGYPQAQKIRGEILAGRTTLDAEITANARRLADFGRTTPQTEIPPTHIGFSEKNLSPEDLFEYRGLKEKIADRNALIKQIDEAPGVISSVRQRRKLLLQRQNQASIEDIAAIESAQVAPVGARRTPQVVTEAKALTEPEIAPTGAPAVAEAMAGKKAAAGLNIPEGFVLEAVLPFQKGVQFVNPTTGEKRIVTGLSSAAIKEARIKLSISKTPAPVSAAPPAKPPVKPPRRPLWADIPPEPAREPSRMPPVGEKLPSGRRPGGPERMKPSAPSDNYARLQEALAPDKEPVVARLRTGLNTFMERFSDRNHAFWQLQKETGIKVHDLAQVVPGSTAAGQNIVRKLTYPIYSALGKDVKFLEEYMVLLRASDILALNPAARLPGGIEGAAGLRQAMLTLEKKLGPERLTAIRNASDQLWKVNDEQVRMALVREGIITKAARNAMNADHPHYIPFQRADFTDALAEGMARPEASVSSTGIVKMAAEGSERALSDPLIRMDAQIIKTQQVIARNRAAKGVVQSLIEIQNSTGQEFVRFIEPKRTLNIAERVTGEVLPRATKAEHSKIWETISYFDNGEKVTVEVPAIYGRVANGLDGEAGGLLSQVARALSAPLRHGAVTYNPAFLIINPLRDATSAFWREKLIPFSPEYFKGWSAVIQKNATFDEAAQSGALLSGIVDTMKSTKALTRAKDIGNLTVRNPKDALLLIPRLLERMNITAEQATRVAVFRKARIEGADALTAAVKARNATVDFAKMGTTMRIINDVYPFSNAALQGTINTFAVIKNNPTWAAIAASPFVVLTVMSRVNNMRFETSDQIPDYWYGSYWVFQFAEGTKPDGTKFPIYFKLPKGPVGSLLTFPGEALFNAARAQEDRSSVELLLQAGLEAAKSTSPVEPTFGGLVPTAAGQTLAGLATGVDLYRGQPIVPAREEQLAPEQQFGPETSKAAIALGTRFKVSPRLIDFAINDYLAGAGQSSNWMLSAALDAVGYKPEPFGAAREEAVARRLTPVEQISKAPVTGRFLGTTGNQLERRGWEQFREAVAATNQEFSRIPGMNSLGVRLGSVGDSIDLRPEAVGGSRDLTPQERTKYQLAMAQAVNLAMPDYVATIEITDPEKRRTRIQKKMDALKDKARVEFIKQLRQTSQPAPRSQPTPRQWVSPGSTPIPATSNRGVVAPTPTPERVWVR